jgi:plasmid stabilization system protein ParE
MAIAYRLTSAAENDFIEILDYTTREWGISQAEKYAAEIEVAFRQL